MLQLNRDFGARVEKRLQEEEIIWFTTVSPRGIPSSNPVWFYWDGELIIVFSQPESHRVRNIQGNPNVSLHLQGVDGLGNNVIVVNGRAVLKPNNKSIPPGYWDKYTKLLAGSNLTAVGMLRDYSVEIRVEPLRIRGE